MYTAVPNSHHCLSEVGPVPPTSTAGDGAYALEEGTQVFQTLQYDLMLEMKVKKMEYYRGREMTVFMYCRSQPMLTFVDCNECGIGYWCTVYCTGSCVLRMTMSRCDYVQM